MTSVKQAAANRRNAQRSTGPTTDAGRAVARLNAVKHGGLSPLPVIPNIEKSDEWQAHLAGMITSLSPVGHLETVLAERVALTLWRLQRLARYEREVTAVGQERVVADVAERRRLSFSRSQGPDHPDDVRALLREAQRRLRAIESFYRLPDDTPLTGRQADTILHAVGEPTEEIDPETFEMPKVVPNDVTWESFDAWTAGRVRQGIAAMAAAEGTSADDLLAGAHEHLRIEAVKLKAESERVETDLDHLRRERLLPDGAVVERIVRYEAHLGRQLAQALHELQRLQAARAGEPMSPPAALDVTISGAD